MGLLDDAIREHLELKRRHGADPEEVARQENEALGETRRAEFARPEGVEGEIAPAAETAPAAEAEPEAAVEPVEEPVAPPEFLAAEPPPAAVDAPADAADAEEPVEAGDEREPFDIEAVEPAPAPEADPATEEWPDSEPDEVPADEALDHPRGADPEPGEDVLEETPDFLQETPEHDRLWFEQRPPRDFDWDK